MKLLQLTGDEDRPRHMPTCTLTAKRAGVVATDLGSSFEHRQKLYFLFGDTVGGRRDADVLAWTDARRPEDLTLKFHLSAAGTFSPLAVPGVSLGAFEIPSYGVSVEGRMYVVFTTDHSEEHPMGRSVMTVSRDDGRTFEALYDLSRTHFINVAMAHAGREKMPGLPGGTSILIWGSGEYRKSSPRLACASPDALASGSGLRYFAGLRGGRPSWSLKENEAAPVLEHPVVGEFSVAWIAPLERWVMLYNSPDPRGIVMRTAVRPWGPWSESAVIFDPWADGGYAAFMHVSWAHRKLDHFHDPGRQQTWGGEYGPYLIPRFITGTNTRCTLVYTMSTWNPYQVVVMSSDVGFPDRVADPGRTELLTLPPDPSWRSQNLPFKRVTRNGKPHLTTSAGRGNTDTGVAWRSWTCGAESELRFALRGGFGEVVLVAGGKPPQGAVRDVPAFYRSLKAGRFGQVVEAIAGPGQNRHEVPVRWNLARLAGRRICLFIIDHLEGPWGFISTSAFTLRQGNVPR